MDVSTVLEKIKPLSEIAEIVAQAKAQGKIIVTTNGSYDIIHAGHVKSLYEAKSQGDLLVVGINSDASVKAYKSPDRPIIGQEDRTVMVAGLGCVDYVFTFDELDPIAFLEVLQPHIHANGADYGEDCIEGPTVKKHGGRLFLLTKYDGISTSEIIRRIVTTTKN
jgi:rfaE bifunctional protein nucleotidyltransferase chain/domain